jgi:hypothetical protein
MKKSQDLSSVLLKIQKFAPTQGGVFSYGDLFHLIGAGDELKNRRMINQLVKSGLLFKVQRGFYLSDKPDLWVLASRLKKDACISLDTVLAKEALLGSLPTGSVSATYSGIRKLVIKTPVGLIRYFSMQRNLQFGYNTLANGVRVADKEKAFLDILYFYAKGSKFAIDPVNEIDVRKLNKKKLKQYLKHYANPKFVKFVKGVVGE